MNMHGGIEPLTALRIRAVTACHDTRGVILPLTFFILVLLAGLVAALLSVGATESQISANLLRTTQAFDAAEAGAENAIAQFVANPALVGRATGTTTLFTNQTLGSVAKYTVTYQPLGASTVLIKSTGTSSIGNVVQKIQVVVATPPGLFPFAVLGDDVQISGTNTICGNAGGIFGNTQVVITDVGPGNGSGNCGPGGNTGGPGSGNNRLPWIDQTAQSAGATCTLCTYFNHVGNPSGSGPNQPAQSLPPNSSITDSIYQSSADFVMDATGSITIMNNPPAGLTVGSVVTCGDPPGCTSGPFAGWYNKSWQPGDWHFQGTGTPPNGTYKAPLEISIDSTVGTASNPWKVTLLVGDSTAYPPTYPNGHPGEWEVYSSNSFMVPAGNPAFPNLLGVGGAVILEGNNTTLTGTLISTTKSRGLTPPSGKVSVLMDQGVTLKGNIVSDGQVLISGTSAIIYNLVGGAGGFGAPQIISWTRLAQ